MAPQANGSNGINPGQAKAPEFMAAQPKGRPSLCGILKHGNPTKVSASPTASKKMTWQQTLSMNFVKILWLSYPFLKFVGFLVEWTINFFALNGLFSLLYKLIFLKWGEIIIPDPSADNYSSIVGQLDPRCDLHVDKSKASKASSTQADAIVFPNESAGSRSTANVCVMAAKLSYENPAFVKRVVEQNWKMKFVKFYNCWNGYQEMNNTQAFVCMDKPTNANAIVIAFRGTEAFNAYDWSTDVDFSWMKLPDLGGVHLGFLEALGLIARDIDHTLTSFTKKAAASNQKTKTQEQEEAIANNVPPSPHHKSEDEIKNASSSSGLKPAPDQILAYDQITKDVALILNRNPRAKLFITGHSLGGALASLYATMLHYTGETEVASKIGAVYTFGQPRVGDEHFADYATEKLHGRYFRVVYCNDVVPRVPFDNVLFSYKHFGNCAYFNSVYDGLTLREEPNRNFFGLGRFLTMHLNAIWEAFQGGILISLQHGHDYSESITSALFRTLGLLLPGISSHSPCNYVNAVCLGPFPLREIIKGDIADIAQEFHLMHDNVMDIVRCVSAALLSLIPGQDTVWNAASEKFLRAINK